MKAERDVAANTLRGTLLPRMANPWTLAKHRIHHPSKGSLPSSRKKVFRLSKNKRSGSKASEGSCPLLTSLAIYFEIWERESAPADYFLMCRLSSMVHSKPNLPTNELVGVGHEARPHLTARICALGSFTVCFLCIVPFKSSFSLLALVTCGLRREPSCIK